MYAPFEETLRRVITGDDAGGKSTISENSVSEI